MIAKRVIFEGRVQGVGFRSAVLQLSHSYEIGGWVRNLHNGSVELKVMGEAVVVEAFIHEIAEKSNVTHYVKSLRAETIPPMPPTIGLFIMPD